MFLVGGMGNPGEEYADTPHNEGFMVVARLAEMQGIRVNRKDSKALAGVGEIAGKPVMLAKPQTFMNLSGTSVAPLMEKHGFGLADLIVVWDELNLPWGGLRILKSGSAGGHNRAGTVVGRLQAGEILGGGGGGFPGGPRFGGGEELFGPVKRSQKKRMEDLGGLAARHVRSQKPQRR